MKNSVLLKEVMTATRNATVAYHNYMYTDKEYVKGQKLYLREMHFLVFVGDSSELTMSEIALKMNITQGAATQISSRLLKKGLIQKLKSSEDRRFSVITLTEAGRNAYSEYLNYDRIRNEEVSTYLNDFSESDLQVILRFETMIQDICSGKIARENLLQ